MKENWKPGTLIYPLPAVLVSCGATPDEYNLLTVAWTGTVCTNPPMCYISIRPERHSYDIIRRTGEFVINLTTEELARATDWCGVRSGRDHDKFRETGLTPAPATVVKAPVVAEAPLSIECRVRQILPLGSHDLFLAEVVNIQADNRYIDPETGTVGNGRTYFYSYDMWVRAQYKSESSYTEIYRQKYVDGVSDPSYPTFVQGPTFDAGDGTNPFRLFAYTGYPYVLRLGAAFRPTVDKDSYLVMPKLTRPEAKNVGKDSPFVIKGSDDEQPASYQYTFTAPGTYQVAVVGTVTTLAGEKQILLRKSVTVTE